MTTVAIIEPLDPVGRELREQLPNYRQHWAEAHLLTADPEAVGTLTDVGGNAAMVRALPGGLDGIDLAFVCGPGGGSALLADLPEATRAVVTSPDRGDGPLSISGLGLADRGPVVRCAGPEAILLAHLLAPLASLGLRRATATLVAPVSRLGLEALDELMEQARSILAFQSVPDSRLLGRRLVFDLVGGEGGNEVRDQVAHVLDPAPDLAVEVLQAGIFHGLSASVLVELDEGATATEVEEAIGASPVTRLEDGPSLSPTVAAGADQILFGPPRAEPGRPGAFWLWSVMDNLTRGGALNALELGFGIH